jgi:hypothetical protein
MIGPLFELNDEARHTMSPLMAKCLQIAGLEHIGKIFLSPHNNYQKIKQ